MKIKDSLTTPIVHEDIPYKKTYTKKPRKAKKQTLEKIETKFSVVRRKNFSFKEVSNKKNLRVANCLNGGNSSSILRCNQFFALSKVVEDDSDIVEGNEGLKNVLEQNRYIYSGDRKRDKLELLLKEEREKEEAKAKQTLKYMNILQEQLEMEKQKKIEEDLRANEKALIHEANLKELKKAISSSKRRGHVVDSDVDRLQLMLLQYENLSNLTLQEVSSLIFNIGKYKKGDIAAFWERKEIEILRVKKELKIKSKFP